MAVDIRIFETHLRRYVVLYFMLGLIERELRERCLITLSGFSDEKGYSKWFYVIPATKENIRALRKALKKNGFRFEGLEQHLSFSFWRHLFDGKNFTTLWVPTLHTIFPSLEKAQSHRSFSQVSNHMARANKIRNRVAHYEIQKGSDYESDKAVLMWIIRKMGGVSV
jgi:hypothetical protein